MNENKFSKSFSMIDLLFMATGAMLGWGWVVLSGDWVSHAGFGGTAIAFAIGGILIIFIGLTYAELASSIPRTGGGMVFVLRAFKPKIIGYFAAWSVLFGYVSVITFEAVALPTVIDYILPFEHMGHLWTVGGDDVFFTWVIIGSIGSIILTSLNYFGVTPAKVVQNVLTLGVVAAGILLMVSGFTLGDSGNLDPVFGDGVGGIMTVLIMIPFLFVGFDVIPQIAAEVKSPPRLIGRILIGSIIVTVIFYVLIAFGVSMGLTEAQIADSDLATADAMRMMYNSQFMANIIVIAGVAGIITSWNAFIIGGSRILYAMSIRRMIPEWFSKIHPRYNTPVNAILFLGILGAVAPLLGHASLNWFVNAGGIGIVLGYLIVSISFLKLRKTEPELNRPFSIKNWKVVGLIAIILSVLFILIYLPFSPSSLVWPMEWLIVIGWYLIGFIFFMLGSEKGINRDYNGGMNANKEIDK
ncbi:APC family permease [Salinicoccus kekensis]|uniref:Amino acid/polyamine/organocation transporter (APC superfamily) n=1 Tax=Salinicoccus kekensis TaxID=714307 RepID=A0A285UP08_9STAP|nr:APC family permease [Salinicoccus kekensis]SOC43645.1 amino acid/polyamine/organocation transporter (APC superfamily) [Salinicoccus kekensis]